MSEDKKAVETKDQSHKRKMQNQKEKIDAKIAASDEERGVMILLTGDGKGKSSSAFGMGGARAGLRLQGWGCTVYQGQAALR